VIKGGNFSVHEPGILALAKDSWHGAAEKISLLGYKSHQSLLAIRSYEGDFSQNLDLSVLNVQVISFCESLGLRN